MKVSIVWLGALLPVLGCTEDIPTRIVAQTPAMVSIETNGRYREVVPMAQQACAAQGRDARQTSMDNISVPYRPAARYTFACVSR